MNLHYKFQKIADKVDHYQVNNKNQQLFSRKVDWVVTEKVPTRVFRVSRAATAGFSLCVGHRNSRKTSRQGVIAFQREHDAREGALPPRGHCGAESRWTSGKKRDVSEPVRPDAVQPQPSQGRFG